MLWQGRGIGGMRQKRDGIYRTLAFPGPTSRERKGRRYPQDLNLGICSCTKPPSRRPNREETEGHFRSRGQGPTHIYNPVWCRSAAELET
jgi:hypothetical protein